MHLIVIKMLSYNFASYLSLLHVQQLNCWNAETGDWSVDFG